MAGSTDAAVIDQHGNPVTDAERQAAADRAAARADPPVGDPIDTPVVVDGDDPPARRDEETGGDDGPGVGELRAKPSLFDQERDAIGARYAAKRAKELGLTVADDDAPEPPATIVTPTPAPAPAPAASAPRLDSQPSERRHKLKVNGTELEVSDTELIRMAQEGLATGITLTEAKGILADARKGLPVDTRRAAPNQGDQPRQPARTTDQPDPARPKTTVDPAQLLPVARALQVGTEEEAAEALATFLTTDRSTTPAAPADETVLDGSVARVLDRRRATEEAEEALGRFKSNYPALVVEDDYMDMVVKQTAREIIADFKRIGVPESDIAAASANPNLLINGYRELRQQRNPATGQPWDLRAYDQILDASAAAVAKKVGITLNPTPGAEPGKVVVDTARRAAAKDILTPQPRSAGLPTDAGRLSGQERAQVPQRQSGADIVAAERRSRGFG